MNQPCAAVQCADDSGWYHLEQQQLFAQSRLWQIQRDYYASRGAAAWSQDQVPYYVTSNPTAAYSYADIAFAFHQDRQRLHPNDQVQLLCELGAGSGCFAFHFLSRLLALCQQHGVAPQRFRYVLTDFTQSNLDAWRVHPTFRRWFDSGLLDMALFDVNQPAPLQLQCNGQLIGPASMALPVIVLANYVFDGVAQDMFFFNGGVTHDCLVSLITRDHPDLLDPASLLEQVGVRFDYRPLSAPAYPELQLQAQLDQYARYCAQAHVLFPASALRCLAYLKALSPAGMLLLSADKGDHELVRVAQEAPPSLAWHNSFSVCVNYHAFQQWCEAQGGLALLPAPQHQYLDVIALLLVEAPVAHTATRLCFQQQVVQFGPDDFFTLTRSLQRQVPSMDLPGILAMMRFCRHDAYQLALLMPRLMALAPSFAADAVTAVRTMVDTVWERYFPLNEAADLAFDIGSLLYDMDDYAGALLYFERTDAWYGGHAGTAFNRAACHERLGQFGAARSLLQQLLLHEPGNAPALALLASLPAAAGGV